MDDPQVDTGSEAVEALAGSIERLSNGVRVPTRMSATLRALAAERDALSKSEYLWRESYENAARLFGDADRAYAAETERAEAAEAERAEAAEAERDAAIARAEAAEAERDALVRVAEAARRERRVDMDGRSTPDTRAAARQALDEAVDALPPGQGQSEG